MSCVLDTDSKYCFQSKIISASTMQSPIHYVLILDLLCACPSFFFWPLLHITAKRITGESYLRNSGPSSVWCSPNLKKSFYLLEVDHSTWLTLSLNGMWPLYIVCQTKICYVSGDTISSAFWILQNGQRANVLIWQY